MESNAEETQDEGQESKGTLKQPLTFARFCRLFCVCASLRGLTYLQWLSLVLVCDTIAVPFSVGSLTDIERHDGLSFSCCR